MLHMLMRRGCCMNLSLRPTLLWVLLCCLEVDSWCKVDFTDENIKSIWLLGKISKIIVVLLALG